MSFQVQLPIYRGPLELLWYLIRKNELDVTSIELAKITEQYLDYLVVLEQLDVNLAGEFLDIASQLIEMKSRSVLPHTEEIPEEVVDEPGESLVRHLLEYKKYRDVASLLDERAQEWQQTYPRMGQDLTPRARSLDEQPIREVELWDLVSALGRVMREQEIQQSANIVYDETPIQTYIKAVHERLADRGEVAITDLLRMGMSKSAVIGLFLAVLELVRHHSVEAEQEEGSVEIVVRPGPNFGQPLDLSQVDSYQAAPERE